MEHESTIRKPMVLVFAGPNGSGKSSITSCFEKVGEYTNADDLTAAAGISNEEAALQVDERRYRAIEMRRDLTFETVLSSDYKLAILRKAKESGYFIKCIFVLTSDPQINVKRVKSRSALGGHSVDEEKIVKRYYKSLANIKVLLELCDILHVFDNTLEKPVRIIRKHKDEFTVYPNEIWTKEKISELL